MLRFCIRSQMSSNCGKNKEVAHELQASVSLMFPHVLTSSVWSITDQAHGNMESISIVQWRERKKLHIYIPASYHLTVRGSICAALQVTKATFRPSLFFSSLSYLHTVYPKSFSTPFAESRITVKTFPNLRWQAMANFIKNSSKCGISKSLRTLIVSVSPLFLFIDSLR